MRKKGNWMKILSSNHIDQEQIVSVRYIFDYLLGISQKTPALRGLKVTK